MLVPGMVLVRKQELRILCAWSWVHLEAAAMPVAAHLQEHLVPLNGKIKEMLQKDKGQYAARCATHCLSSIKDGKTSSRPQACNNAGRKGRSRGVFLVSVICHSGSRAAACHLPWWLGINRGALGPRSSICRVSTVERLSLMSKEDEVYKAMGDVYDGKMCVVEGTMRDSETEEHRAQGPSGSFSCQ